jgi:hypothetical protein
MYLSGLPGTPTATASGTSDRLLMSMKEAEARIKGMSPAEQKEFLQFLLLIQQNLPPSQQQKADDLFHQAVALDPRGVPGLGQIAAVGSLSTIANIAGIVASLGSLGVGVYGAYQGYKDQKAQTAAQSEIASAQAASLRAETTAKQQEVALMQQAAAGSVSGCVGVVTSVSYWWPAALLGSLPACVMVAVQ